LPGGVAQVGGGFVNEIVIGGEADRTDISPIKLRTARIIPQFDSARIDNKSRVYHLGGFLRAFIALEPLRGFPFEPQLFVGNRVRLELVGQRFQFTQADQIPIGELARTRERLALDENILGIRYSHDLLSVPLEDRFRVY